MITILKAKPKDAFELSQVAKTIWEEIYIPINGKQHVTYMLEQFQSKPVFLKQIKHQELNYFIAKENRKIIAYFAFTEKEEKVFISKLYVRSNYRHKGVASRFLTLLPKNKNWYLTVNKHNSSAQKCYEKWGFKITEKRKTPIGQGYYMDDFIMEKNHLQM